MAGDHLSDPRDPLDPPERARRAAYLTEVASRLRGPRRQRERILAELSDGLDEAIAGAAATGPPQAAVAAAIARFGPARAVSDAFAAELAIGYARQVIVWYVATGPLVGIWWLLLLHPRPWRTGVVSLLVAIPVIPLVAAAVLLAVGTVATTGRLIRWLPETGPRRALTAVAVVAGLALAADVTAIVMYARLGPPVSPPAVAAVAAVAAPAASLIRIGWSLLTVLAAARMRRAVTAAELGRPPGA